MGELADFLNDPGESDSQPGQQPAAGGLAAELNPVTDPQGQEDFYDRMRKRNKVADIFREEALKTPMPASAQDTTDYASEYSLPAFQKRLQDEAPWLTDQQRQAQYDQFRQQAPLAAQGSALDAAIKKARSGDINRLAPLSPGQERVLRDLPLVGGAIGAITGQGSAAAQERFRQGKATQSDINTIALDTAEQEREAKKGGLERTVNVAEKLPAFLTEWSMLAGPAGAGRAAAQAAVERGLGLGAESLAGKAVGALGAGAARTLLRPDIPIAAAAQGQSPGRAALDQMVQNTVFEGLNPFVRRQGDALLARWAKGMGTAMSANEAAADIQDVFKGKLPQSGPFAALAHADTPQERQRAWDNLKAQVAAFGGLEGFINARGSIAEQMARRTEEPARPTPGIIATPEATQMSPSQTERLNQPAPAAAQAEAPIPEKPSEIAPGSTQAAQAAPTPPGETAPPAQSQAPPASLDEAMARAGLSKFEQKVVRDRLDGSSHQDIANDLMLSRQRVQQIERGAMRKLGADFSMEDFNATRREEERGEAEPPGRIDLPQGPPTAEEQAAVKRAKAPLSAQERKGRALQALADKLLENAHEPLSDSERASYEAEAARIVNGPGEEPAAPGPARGLPGEVAAAPRNVVPGAAEHAGGGEGGAAPGEGAGPAGEPAGAAAPQPAGQPGAGEPVRPGAAVAPPRPERVDPVEKIARGIAADEGGAANLGRIQELYDRLKSGVQSVGHGLAELAGKMAPRTTALDRESGEALTRFNAAPTYAKEAAPYYIDKVMGPGATQADRRLAGAVITERRLRRIRDVLTANGDRAAANVKTIVGQPDSPLQSEAEYQQALASPKMQGILQRWKQEFVPVMESNYRRAEGLEDTDPIPGETQIPGEPVNLKAVGAGEQPTDSTVFTGQGRGNLKNVKLRKLGFARQAKGGAAGYDIDLGAIVENSLAKGTSLAAKAEMARTMVANGVAEWAKPGDQIEGATEVPFSRPPKGTQEAGAREVLFVKDEAYPEVRQALQVDQPMRFAGLSAFNNLLTKAALASTVEAAYHSKNLLTMFTKPGVSPVDFVQNAYKVMTKDPGTAKELVELARIGALKEGGFESGQTSKYNPLTYMGRFLGFLDRTMRLTADDAFDRLERQGRVEGSETNRRDFINQLGQYNRRAQNRAVVLLRDTGFGPFATAGTNYYMQGLKAMALDPGVKATSPQAAVGLRAEVLGRTVGVVAAAALANYFRWGRIDGDDKTPLGAVKVGEGRGKTSYFDLTAFTGLTRGLRQTGLLSLAEGARAGARQGPSEDTAVDNIIHGALHPAVGPAVQFGYTAATGKDTLGRQVAPKAKGGDRQWVNDFAAALKNANPVIGSLGGFKHPGKETPLGQRALELAGPYGVKERATAPGQERRRR